MSIEFKSFNFIYKSRFFVFVFFNTTLYCNLCSDPTKFFGCELGAQTQFDTKNDRYIVNGSHEANKLQDMLDGFIRKFVLCPECDNPETDLVNTFSIPFCLIQLDFYR